MTRAKVSSWVLGTALSLGLDRTVAQACSVCITGDNDPTAQAFNASVLFLIVTPYLVVGSIAVVLYVVYRRTAATWAQEEAAAEPGVHIALKQEESGR